MRRPHGLPGGGGPLRWLQPGDGQRQTGAQPGRRGQLFQGPVGGLVPLHDGRRVRRQALRQHRCHLRGVRGGVGGIGRGRGRQGRRRGRVRGVNEEHRCWIGTNERTKQTTRSPDLRYGTTHHNRHHQYHHHRTRGKQGTEPAATYGTNFLATTALGPELQSSSCPRRVVVVLGFARLVLFVTHARTHARTSLVTLFLLPCGMVRYSYALGRPNPGGRGCVAYRTVPFTHRR
mmetsp:Transcript_22342/g.48555  ORF Transcript_22342/g.48555 Transcript_22342/m.48555 type:complete len:232 (+) Transcript_22342:1283-1978(+)